MRRISLIILICLGLIMLSCEKTLKKDISIIPIPECMVELGGCFEISASTKIVINQDSLFDIASYFQDLLAKAGMVVQIHNGEMPADLGGTILFSIVNSSTDSLGTEGYRLKVLGDRIIVEANSNAGCFYAVQSLRQLMPMGFENGQEKFKELPIPCVEISDKPKFVWRGLHLDCCRHFMDKNFVIRYIDLIAYHKMNTLHWHLTDDQGWRIEIEAYPKLTEVGAWRTEADGSIHGGFYSKEDIMEIVAYAASRYVNIVPEIEMPGHAVAAIASYPELSCTGEKIEVETSWGVFKDIFCAGNEKTFTFLQTVLSEVVELFPYRYIHIGGDEAPKYRWENCEKCKSVMKKSQLKDFEELQRYFIDRIGSFLEQKNREIIGWDEIMDGGLPKNATIQAWRGMDKVMEAVKKGAKVVAMPTSHCYFDYSVGVTDLERVYTFNPIPDGLTPQQQKLVLGGECALWTERAPQHMVDAKLFPRLLAISEILWSYPTNRSYNDFRTRIRAHYERLAELGVRYGFEQNAVEFQNSLSDDGSTMTVAIKSGQDYFRVCYTTDGTNPTSESKEYVNPIVFKESVVIKAAAFNGSAQVDEVFVNNIVITKTTGKQLTLNYTPAKQYTGGGENALVDGRKGSYFYNDGVWQAVQGTPDLQATVDLGSEVEVSDFNIGFLQSNPSWIFIPAKVIFCVSSNGVDFVEVAEVVSPVKPRDGGNIIHNFSQRIKPTKCRFVKMVATSIGPCPEWHPAAGSDSWLFVDEFSVN